MGRGCFFVQKFSKIAGNLLLIIAEACDIMKESVLWVSVTKNFRYTRYQNVCYKACERFFVAGSSE